MNTSMKKTPLLAFPFLMLLMAAGDPPGFTVWKASDLKARARQLAAKMNDQKLASETLADYGRYNTMLAHREATGGAELHQKMADLFVIQSGDATVVVGGAIADGHTTGPGEVRGTEVTGGERHRVSAGDVVHIPANTPHQMLLDAGHQVTYFVVKVESR
jgi:mannose-6-phosphate isomerase-like protein (cupin superfamily)